MKAEELPDILTAHSHEELDALAIKHAKYFTCVQVQLGGFVKNGTSNYDREELPNLDAAREHAKKLYEVTRKSVMIYAIADFSGARNFSRHVENYPEVKSPFKNKPLRKTPVITKQLEADKTTYDKVMKSNKPMAVVVPTKKSRRVLP